jgi:hypothetical protein
MCIVLLCSRNIYTDNNTDNVAAWKPSGKIGPRVNKQAVSFQIILIKSSVSSTFAGDDGDDYSYEAEKFYLLSCLKFASSLV